MILSLRLCRPTFDELLMGVHFSHVLRDLIMYMIVLAAKMRNNFVLRFESSQAALKPSIKHYCRRCGKLILAASTWDRT